MHSPPPVISRTIICYMLHVPICCAEGAQERKRRRATGERSRWPPMRANVDFSSDACSKLSFQAEKICRLGGICRLNFLPNNFLPNLQVFSVFSPVWDHLIASGQNF